MSRAARLFEELRAYEPADELEAGHRHAMLDLVRDAAEPFSRAHFAPGHVTASCFIIDDGGRLLLHHHRRLDRWLQMGGHVEGDETPDAAALREGAEESGLTDLELLPPSSILNPQSSIRASAILNPQSSIRASAILNPQSSIRASATAIFDLDIHKIPAARHEPDHDHFDVRYLARTSSPDAITIDRGESNELAWVALDPAAALMPHAESLRVLRKIERLLRERSVS
ncbi:MAG TPA: NUDIX domain-containing protein [Thermoanaerobaculia bacterium]|nr:NUDIX domain-containing protein [Thermoanaerobaculia bacterium]